MNEKDLRYLVAETAAAYIGAKQGDARHREIVSIYNSQKPLPRGYPLKVTDHWCAGFVTAIGHKLDLTSIIYPECGVEKMIAKYKAAGRWREDENYLPKPGDVMFYDWQDGPDFAQTDNRGVSDHVGIVRWCDGKTIAVVEGNSNGACKELYRPVNGRYLRGFGLPDYASKCDKEDDVKIYDNLAEIPDWARPHIKHLCDSGDLTGSGAKDADGYPADLNLTMEGIRILVILERHLEDLHPGH